MTNTPAYRISCCVPFCRRTRKRGNISSWICGPHWAAVPKKMRQVHFRINRQYRKKFGDNSYWIYPAGSPDRLEAVRLDRRSRTIWKRIMRLAIERAVGI